MVLDTPLLSRAATVAGATLISRLLGFVRDMCMAWLLGGSPAADALVPALRLPNLIRRLLGEGTLSISLTADFSRFAPPEDAFNPLRKIPPCRLEPFFHLAASLGLRLTCVLACAVVLGELFARPLLALLAPGLAEQPEIARHSVFLLRVCLPYIVFAGTAAVAMAMLHSLRSFFLPSFSSACFNLTMLAFAGLAALRAADPAFLLALGMLCGGITQFLFQIVALRRLDMRFSLTTSDSAACEKTETSPKTPEQRQHGQAPDAGDPKAHARAALRRLPSGILGAAAPQFALLGTGVLASYLSGGSLAALYYAERILDFPLALTGAALGMAGLPSLAALAAAQKTENLHKEARRAFRLALCLSLPAAAGLAAIAEPLTHLLFFRGAFDAQALSATTLALCAYVPALPACAASRPLLALCNACGKTRLTAFSSCAAVPLAFASGAFLMPWGIIGPPLGFSLGMWAQIFMLHTGLSRGGAMLSLPVSVLLRYAAGSALVFASARFALHLLPGSPVSLMLAVVTAAVLYFCFLSLSGDPDMRHFFRRPPKTP